MSFAGIQQQVLLVDTNGWPVNDPAQHSVVLTLWLAVGCGREHKGLVFSYREAYLHHAHVAAIMNPDWLAQAVVYTQCRSGDDKSDARHTAVTSVMRTLLEEFQR